METVTQKLCPAFLSSAALWMLSQLPAQAEATDFSQGSFSKESYYVTLGLFVLSVPGMLSVMPGHWRLSQVSQRTAVLLCAGSLTLMCLVPAV